MRIHVCWYQTSGEPLHASCKGVHAECDTQTDSSASSASMRVLTVVCHGCFEMTLQAHSRKNTTHLAGACTVMLSGIWQVRMRLSSQQISVAMLIMLVCASRQYLVSGRPVRGSPYFFCMTRLASAGTDTVSDIWQAGRSSHRDSFLCKPPTHHEVRALTRYLAGPYAALIASDSSASFPGIPQPTPHTEYMTRFACTGIFSRHKPL